MKTNSNVIGAPDSGYAGVKGTITHISEDRRDAFVRWANHPDPAVAGSWVAIENLCQG